MSFSIIMESKLLCEQVLCEQMEEKLLHEYSEEINLQAEIGLWEHLAAKYLQLEKFENKQYDQDLVYE